MLQFAAEVLFHVLCGFVGHGVLWVLTLGRWHAPSGGDDLATIVGLRFWVAIGVGVWLVLFR